MQHLHIAGVALSYARFDLARAGLKRKEKKLSAELECLRDVLNSNRLARSQLKEILDSRLKLEMFEKLESELKKMRADARASDEARQRMADKIEGRSHTVA